MENEPGMKTVQIEGINFFYWIVNKINTRLLKLMLKKVTMKEPYSVAV